MNESPQAQEPVAFRVVDGEALLLDGVHEVDGRPLHVRGTHPVDGQGHAAELRGEVTVERAVVEEQVVAQARAASRLDGDAQRQVVAALLVGSDWPWRPRRRSGSRRGSRSRWSAPRHRRPWWSPTRRKQSLRLPNAHVRGGAPMGYGSTVPCRAAIPESAEFGGGPAARPASWLAASSMARATEPA